MDGYEDHITVLEQAEGLPSATVEVASDAIAFVAALQGLYVDSGVLNEDAEVDVGVLENLVDAYHGELCAAALFLSEYNSFKGVPDLLRGTAKTMEDNGGVVPVVVRKGFERLAARIEKAREQRIGAYEALKAQNDGKVLTQP